MKKRLSKKKHVSKRSYFRHALPVTVWLTCVAVVVWLFYHRTQQFQVLGVACGQIRQVSVTSTGRIREMSVELFQPVTAGQTLAVVDTVLENEQALQAELEMDLATAAAETERLGALLIPTQEQLQADAADSQINRADNDRRFAVDVESARLRILELQVTIASDRVILNDVSVEVKKLADLVAKEVMAPYELERLQAQYESLASKIEQNERLLEQARATLRQAEDRHAEFSTQTLPTLSVDHALDAIRKEITVQEALMKGALAQLKALESRRSVTVTSPIDGVIVPLSEQTNDTPMQSPEGQVMHRVGEVVTAGEPLFAVVQTEPTEIIAYVGESQLGVLKDAMIVELITTREPRQIAQSFVSAVGPVVELKPQRLWRHPQVAEWGRPVLIQIPPGLSVVPGEVVGVRQP